MPPWLRQTFAALAVLHFRVLWVATLFAFTGFFMSTVVNGVMAFELTGSNTAVGLVVFSQGLAMTLLGPLGGAYADRLPKRRVVVVGSLTSGLVFAATGGLTHTGAIAMWHLALGAGVLGSCFAFHGPARQAIVPDIVPADRRGNAMALSQVANNASRVSGPALAGWLLAWPALGAAGAYFTMAGLYAMAALSLSWLPRSRRRGDLDTRVLADVVAGLRYVRARPQLRVLLLMFVAVIMTGFPYIAVLPGFVANQLERGPETVGLLMGVAALGGLATSVAVARFADSPRARGIYSGLGLAFGASLVALSRAPDYHAALWLSFAVGAANGGFQTLANACLLHATEALFVGRVMSLSMLAFGGFGLMGLPIGALADAFGERTALAAMGVVVCSIVLGSWSALARADAA